MCGNYVPISIIGRSKLVWIDSDYKSQWTLYSESKHKSQHIFVYKSNNSMTWDSQVDCGTTD